jgi:DNA-directed RNA polymerase sigma subunit (sigma70/sigma32)
MPTVRQQTTRIRVAKEFVKNHGKAKLEYLLTSLQNGLSGQLIANELGVTRERIRQWKIRFGEEKFVYQPKQYVIRVLNGGEVPKQQKVLKNLVKNRGKNVFRVLINDLVNNRSGQAIANKMSVSRERIRQWKNKFGTTTRVYSIHPEILAVLKKAR